MLTLHPRPQLTRDDWIDLCGEWDFCFDDQDVGVDDGWWRAFPPAAKIIVPFPPESPASGLGDRGVHEVVWYRRALSSPQLAPGERLVLHVGACDYEAAVWCNGQFVGRHEGGHTPFSCDLTPVLAGERLELILRAHDDPADIAKSLGKQDWSAQPHAVWYPRTTGLWQPVWLERVPRRHVVGLSWHTDVSRGFIGCHVVLSGASQAGERLSVRLSFGEELLADQDVAVRSDRCSVELWVESLVNGVDRDRFLWSPETPTLVDATVSLFDAEGAPLDTVGSYVGIRTVATRDGHFLLNGRPYFLRLVLEQGIWPESHLAAPSEAALREEVALVKRLGFNGVRVHQKIEDPRFLALCDRLGVLAWEEMPSCYAFGDSAVQRLAREWAEVVVRDRSHPSVVCWVPLNESWGVADLQSRPDERSLALALVHLTRALDGSRPVISNDGWEHVDSDILTVHDYGADAGGLRKRYGSPEALETTLGHDWPAGRRILLDDGGRAGRPIMVTEFGGVSVKPGPSAATDRSEEWFGYSTVGSDHELGERFAELVAALLACSGLAGFCYTQLTDTFQERNGLLRADRSPKVPFEVVRAALEGVPASVPFEAVESSRRAANAHGRAPGAHGSRLQLGESPGPLLPSPVRPEQPPGDPLKG